MNQNIIVTKSVSNSKCKCKHTAVYRLPVVDSQTVALHRRVDFVFLEQGFLHTLMHQTLQTCK